MATHPPQQREVPQPDLKEQVRLVAQAVADMRSVLTIINQNALHFLPGESVDEMATAWEAALSTFDELLVRILAMMPRLASAPLMVGEQTLENHELLGVVGAAKTSLLRRMKERFFACWNTLPAQGLENTEAITAGMEYLEFAANTASSIPGGGSIKELLHLYKQQLRLRLK